jgi:ABC-type phosphate/phosphonate transport system substrate-binding protein
VQVIGQPDYSAFEGGQGELYSSAVVMRRDETPQAGEPAPADGRTVLPLDRLRSKRFAFNGADSISGILALTSDLEAMGEGICIFSERIVSGGHRASIVAVAEGRADVAAIDCRSWVMAQRFEPAAKELAVVGWTGRRKGLPYICAQRLPRETVDALLEAATEAGMLAAS